MGISQSELGEEGSKFLVATGGRRPVDLHDGMDLGREIGRKAFEPDVDYGDRA